LFPAILIFLLLLISACSPPSRDIPGKGLMKPSQLVSLLVEMHYYEGIFEVHRDYTGFMPGIGADTLDFYHRIFEKHGIDRETFKDVMTYYSHNAVEFELIYNKVVDELNKRMTDAEMEMYKQTEEIYPPGHIPDP
jgi:hypothetical protein